MADFNVIDVFHPDNTFDVFTPGLNVFLTNFPIVLEDLNNDFQLESITVGGDFNSSNRSAYVFAWKPDGQQASGFPIQIQDNNFMSGTFNLTRVIAGDFDGDGLKDILVLDGPTFTTYALRLFNHDGTPKPFNAPILTGVPAGMAAADLDHNGKLETILVNHSDSVGNPGNDSCFPARWLRTAGLAGGHFSIAQQFLQLLWRRRRRLEARWARRDSGL